MNRRLFALSVGFAAVLGLPLAAAATVPGLAEPLPPPDIDAPSVQSLPADVFFATVLDHCGQAFPGQVLDGSAASAAAAFAGKPLVIHVASCSADSVRLSVQVGDDRSRTWVLGRAGSGLQLRHELHRADGSPEDLGSYGGQTVDLGSAGRQEFPADAASLARFATAGRPAPARAWALEIDAERLVYEQADADGQMLRLAFDLRVGQLPPPPAW